MPLHPRKTLADGHPEWREYSQLLLKAALGYQGGAEFGIPSS